MSEITFIIILSIVFLVFFALLYLYLKSNSVSKSKFDELNNSLLQIQPLNAEKEKTYIFNKRIAEKENECRNYSKTVTELASGDIGFGNGWQRTNPHIGDWGTCYWEEALYIKHGFYAGHTQTECFYITPKSREGHGYFKGDHNYTIHFPKDSFPPLRDKGFWSITANEIPGYFLIPNPVNRYAIRDRTKNLKYNDDGSLDIYIQSDSPGPGKESNWLPIAKGESTTIFRVYLPKEPLLNGTYKLPPIRTVE